MDKGKIILSALGIAVVLLAALLLWNHLFVNRRVLWTYQAAIQDGIAKFDCFPDGGVVLTTSYDIRRLDASGRLKWKSATFSSLNADSRGHIYADPYRDRSIFVSHNGCVLAFDDTGKHLWTNGKSRDDPAGRVIDLAEDGTVAVAFSRSGMKYIDINGAWLKTIPLEGYHGYYPASIGPTGNIYYVYGESMVFHNKKPVYPDSKKKFRRALDMHGNELWKHQGNYMGAYDRFHPLDADTVLIGHRLQGLVAYGADGKELWQADCRTDYGDNISIDPDRIYVSGLNGLRAFSHAGKQLWELKVPFWTFTPQFNGQDVVYCYEEYLPPEIVAKGDKASEEEWKSSTYNLLAVDAANGELLWKEEWKETPGKLRVRPDGSVVIKDGRRLRCLQP